MPPEVSQPTIFINAPNGALSVRNPLYNYAFHPQPSSSDFPPIGGSVRSINYRSVRTTPVANRHHSIRFMAPQSTHSTILYDTQTLTGKVSRTWSTSSCKPTPHREWLLGTAMTWVTDVTRFHTLTYQLITQQPDYGPFSNVGYSDSRGGRYNSIENMHNGIHMLVGNGGHMSNIVRVMIKSSPSPMN